MNTDQKIRQRKEDDAIERKVKVESAFRRVLDELSQIEDCARNESEEMEICFVQQSAEGLRDMMLKTE